MVQKFRGRLELLMHITVDFAAWKPCWGCSYACQQTRALICCLVPRITYDMPM